MLARQAGSGIPRFVNPGDDPHLGGLKNAIQANQLVAIMGTGVSLAVSAPLEVDGFKVASWQGLIQHGIHRCRALGVIPEVRVNQLKNIATNDSVNDLVHVGEEVSGPALANEWARLIKQVPPNLAAQLVLLGRKTATEQLTQVEKGEVPELGIQTRFPDELVTFVAGFLASRGALNTAEGLRWKIVRDTQSWQKAVDEKDVKNILVVHPDLDYEGNRSEFNQTAIANGHAVVFGTLLGRPDTQRMVRLSPPARHELVEVLKKGGVPDAKAEQLARRSNGNVPLVLRYLAGTPERPPWAKPENLEKVRPLALLGGWRSDNPADVAAVGMVVGGDWALGSRAVSHRECHGLHSA